MSPANSERRRSSQPDLRRKKPRLNLNIETNDFIELENAFKGILKTYILKVDKGDISKDLPLLLKSNKNKISGLINSILIEYGACKFNILIEATYNKPLSTETLEVAFKTRNRSVFSYSNMSETLDKMFAKLERESSEFEGKGSGWTLLSVDSILLRLSRYRPLKGSSYIPLPHKILSKRCIINPKNIADTKCFQWAILARHLKATKNLHIVNDRYRRLCGKKYDFSGIDFPTPLKHIKKFERMNPGVSVNVYGLSKECDVYPLRICDKELADHFDLLLLSDEQSGHHYCYITSFSRLIGSQVSKHGTKKVFCKRCFQYYQGSKRLEKLQNHLNICGKKKPIVAIMPHDSNDPELPKMLKFKNQHFQFKMPIVAYCDFECVLRKSDIRLSKNTKINNVHEPVSFCVYLVIDESLPEVIASQLHDEPYLYRGDDAAKNVWNILFP